MITTAHGRKPYPSDVSDEEWEFVAPYVTLLQPDALQRKHELREVFNAVRWLARAGAAWRLLPHDLPPWPIVYQQARRWLAAGSFEALAHDLRMLVRVAQGREPQPSAAILDGRVLQSSPESGHRAAYNGHKRRKGSKVHLAVDTLGQLLAARVTPANADERTQVAALAQAVQEATGQSVEVAYVDQGYTGEEAAAAAAAHGIRLVVVAPYLALLSQDAGQRKYALREVFNGVRYIVRTGAHWRMMPHDLPPWPLVYQQMRRWMAAGCFEAIAHDLRVLLRRAADRQTPPSAAVLDSRTLAATPESGARAGYGRAKRRKRAKVPAAGATFGPL